VELPFRQRELPDAREERTLRLEVIDMVGESTELTAGAAGAADPGPFAHESEAEVCRRVMGDRAHGLETVVAAVVP
jgi:hypothetical protein